MQFAPNSYEDMSLLNAQWAQARPAVAGLGEPPGFGPHSYVDVSYLNARLRPILPATVGLSPDGLGGGSLSGNSLGTDTSGGFTKDQILLAQDLMNGALLQNGYQPIETDGKLGPATCGAIQWYQANIDSEGGSSFNAICSSVKSIPPTKAGGGGGGVRVGKTPGAPSAPARASTLTGGGTNWMLVGSAVAAIAVGGALLYRASKRK